MRLGKPENSFYSASENSSALARHRIRRMPKRKTVQKLKIAWRLCSSRKPFREPCPRMRTPERGQLEAYTIGCQKQPRGFSGQLRHTVTCPRLDLLYQSEWDCARGESKKLLEGYRPDFVPMERRASLRQAQTSRPSKTNSAAPWPTPVSPPVNSWDTQPIMLSSRDFRCPTRKA